MMTREYALLFLLTFMTTTWSQNPADFRQVDFLLIQDVSKITFSNLFTMACMVSDLPKVFENINCISSAPNYVQYLGINPRFGVASFTDIPVQPYGTSKTSPFSVLVSLGLNFSLPVVQRSLEDLAQTALDSGDEPGSQLIAILQACRNEAAVGWRTNATKVILMSTFSSFHKAGDYVNATPNNGDGVVDDLEDYPTIEQAAEACNSNNISIIFLVSEEKVSAYEAIKSDFDSSTVVQLSVDSSNILRAVSESLTSVAPACISNYSTNSSATSGNIYVQCAKRKLCNAVSGVIPVGLPSWIQNTCDSANVRSVFALVAALLLLVTLF